MARNLYRTLWRAASALEYKPKANPYDQGEFSGSGVKRIALVMIGASPAASGRKKGIGQGQKMNDSGEGNGSVRQNEGKGGECGRNVQHEVIGDCVAPEGFMQR